MSNRYKQGLTLIEVLVALAIFTITSVAVISLFPTIFRVNSDTREDQAVTVAAKRFMEDVRGVMTGKKDSSGKMFFDYTENELKSSGQVQPIQQSDVNNYTCSYTVTSIGSAVPSTIKRVALTCSHPAISAKKFEFVIDFGRPSS